MPRKLSDREKKARGTFREHRADRPTVILTVPEAQAAISAASVALALARQKAVQTKPKLTARQKRLAIAAIPVREADLERALEDYSKAVKAEEERASAPSIRAGLEWLSHTEADSLVPPLSADEWLVWLSDSPNTTLEMARKKLAAGRPLTAEEQYWLDGSPQGPDTWMTTFIARLRENHALGFSTEKSRQILAEYDARQKKD